MAKIEVRNWKNKKLKSIDLDDAVFDYPAKPHLVHEAVCAFRAGGRAGTHKVKNRVEVSGGTRKPWRQKGTGRARVGDNRSPLWRHGGTVHGPTPRDYTWKFPKRMRRNALRSVLAEKAREGKLVCLDSLETDSHRTRDLELAVRGGLGLTSKVLLVTLEEDRNLFLAARNNPGISAMPSMGLNVVDLLANDTVVLSEPALERIAAVLKP